MYSLKDFFDFKKKKSLIFGTFWFQARLAGRVFEVPGLDRSLKLTQFLRASMSMHMIASFQTYSSENLGYNEVIKQDYHKLSQDDWVLKVGQKALNF